MFFSVPRTEVQELVNALEGRDPVKVHSVKRTHYLVFQFFSSMQLGGGEALSLAYEPHGQSLAAVHMQTCTNSERILMLIFMLMLMLMLLLMLLLIVTYTYTNPHTGESQA